MLYSGGVGLRGAWLQPDGNPVGQKKIDNLKRNVELQQFITTSQNKTKNDNPTSNYFMIVYNKLNLTSLRIL